MNDTKKSMTLLWWKMDCSTSAEIISAVTICFGDRERERERERERKRNELRTKVIIEQQKASVSGSGRNDWNVEFLNFLLRRSVVASREGDVKMNRKVTWIDMWGDSFERWNNVYWWVQTKTAEGCLWKHTYGPLDFDFFTKEFGGLSLSLKISND